MEITLPRDTAAWAELDMNLPPSSTTELRGDAAVAQIDNASAKSGRSDPRRRAGLEHDQQFIL